MRKSVLHMRNNKGANQPAPPGSLSSSFVAHCLECTVPTLVNVYVALPVFTSVAGRSYAHFMEQNGGAHDINR